ncbi:hypothetical protein [Actinoplanes sp. NPDC051859]|uniref:hypothetical protein n=1 Tax=Actinoplanes sp. NPDC051859 TaxID=3363909 RepID=UPI0037BC250A
MPVLGRLRRRCESLLSSLDISDTRSVQEFATALSRRRGIALHLLPMTLRPSEPCGMWLATAAADFVIYEAEASKHHQDHIIAHELGHIIYGHRGVVGIATESSRLLFPDLDPSLVRDILQRSGYSDVQELEAETMATVIQNRIRRAVASDDGPGDCDDTLDRIKRSLH